MSPDATLSFVDRVRSALRYLYDPAELRRSPLLDQLGLSAADSSGQLRGILTGAIEALKPNVDLPQQPKAWRMYHALYYRYIDQFGQRAVAQAIGLSIRQLRREDSLALRVLAEYLWTHYAVSARLAGSESQASAPQSAADSLGPSREQEIQLLGQSHKCDMMSVRDVLEAAATTMSPLLKATGTVVDQHLSDHLQNVTAPRAVLRQALLNVLTACVRAAPGGTITVTANPDGRHVVITIHCVCNDGKCAAASAGAHTENLEMARRLLALCDGDLTMIDDASPAAALSLRIILRAVEQIPVLVVDDNADALQLYQRYLAGDQYTVTCCANPEQVLATIERTHPRIVLLDVMLPGIDGWELLQRMREDPATQNLRVLVCTIMPEEDLALAMGAAGFLRKPISRQALLAALDQQAQSLG